MNFSIFQEYFFWFEVMAFLTGLAIVAAGRVTIAVFKTLPFYLLFIIAMDIIAIQTDRHTSGIIINRLVIPVEFVYIQLMLVVLLKKPLFKKIALVLIGIYLLLFATDWVLLSGKKVGLYIRSYIAGVTAMVVACILLYYELLNSKRLLAFYKTPLFWFITGLLVFYLGTLPIHLYWNLAVKHDIAILMELKNIFDTLMCIMYLFFAISMYSFLWEKK